MDDRPEGIGLFVHACRFKSHLGGSLDSETKTGPFCKGYFHRSDSRVAVRFHMILSILLTTSSIPIWEESMAMASPACLSGARSRWESCLSRCETAAMVSSRVIDSPLAV